MTGTIIGAVLATAAAVWALFERRRRWEAEVRAARERAERAAVHAAYHRDTERIGKAREALAKASTTPPELARLFEEVFGGGDF